MCDLIEPDASAVERLEFWAARAAKIGCVDISAKFSRSVEAARQASFPNNPDLSKVVKNITQSEKKVLNQNSPQQSIQSPATRRSNPVSISTSGRVNSFTSTTALTSTPTSTSTSLFNTSTNKLEESIDSVAETVSQLVKEVKELSRLALAQGSELKELRQEVKSLRSGITSIQNKPAPNSDLNSSSIGRILSAPQFVPEIGIRSNNPNPPLLPKPSSVTGSYFENSRVEKPQFGMPLNNLQPENNNSPSAPTHHVSKVINEEHENIHPKGPPQPGQTKDSSAPVSVFGGSSFNPPSQNNPPPAFSFAPVTNKSVGQAPLLPTTSSPAVASSLTTQANIANTAAANAPKANTAPSFSFNWSNSNSASNDQGKPAFGFGLNSSSKGGFFGSSDSKNDGGFKWGGNSSNTASWMNTTPQPIFGAPKTNENHEDEAGSDPEEDKVDDSQFKLPVVSNLPSKVEIKTGEEEEEVVYSHRAKVFRFDTNTKEWKERGVGDLKILKHREKNKYRILMRREQVHKIAVNFYITPDMEITPMKNSDTSVKWTAMDYSDETPVFSSLAVKFRNKEILDVFVQKFEECKRLIPSNATPNTTPNTTPSKNEPSNTSEAKETKTPVQVTPTKPTTPHQDQVKSPTTENSSKLDQPKPSLFGSFTSPSVPVFGAPPTAFGSSNPPPSFTFGSLLNKPPGQPAFTSVDSTSTAATTTSTSTAATTTTSNTTPFGLNWTGSNSGSNDQSKPVFGFGLNSSSTGGFFGSSDSKNDGGFKWGGNSSNTASWMNTTPKPIFGAPKTNENHEDEAGSDPEEDKVDDSQFKLPVVSNLPSKVEIKTGEEEEEVVYSHRAKVFRFDTNTKEWKERGVGDLKILKHREKNKYRILMRREQVHKIAVNFYITPDMEITPMKNSDTSVQWTAMDFSDETPVFSSLAVKFKNKEILDDFVKKVEEFRNTLTQPTTAAAEVELVYEKKPVEELIEKARQLQLPDNFYNHLDAEQCQGCRGCYDDKE